MGLFGNKTAPADEGPPGGGQRSRGATAPAGIANEDRTSRSRGFGRADAKTNDGSPSSRENAVATIGKSIIFKGELSGSEDLEVNGTAEGDVKLPDNTLTIGQTGHVKASISAKSVLIVGKVTGDVTATERIEIEASGIVEGDLRAPRLLIQEGAVMNGTVEMGSTSKPAEASKTPTPRSATQGNGPAGSQPSAN
jgi:cytoskeletal protein CcmA (bactofilin family)